MLPVLFYYTLAYITCIFYVILLTCVTYITLTKTLIVKTIKLRVLYTLLD